MKPLRPQSALERAILARNHPKILKLWTSHNYKFESAQRAVIFSIDAKDPYFLSLKIPYEIRNINYLIHRALTLSQSDHVLLLMQMQSERDKKYGFPSRFLPLAHQNHATKIVIHFLKQGGNPNALIPRDLPEDPSSQKSRRRSRYRTPSNVPWTPIMLKEYQYDKIILEFASSWSNRVKEASLRWAIINKNPQIVEFLLQFDFDFHSIYIPSEFTEIYALTIRKFWQNWGPSRINHALEYIVRHEKDNKLIPTLLSAGGNPLQWGLDIVSYYPALVREQLNSWEPSTVANAFRWAVRENQVDLVEMMLEQCIVEDISKITLSDELPFKNDFSMLRLLIQHGLEPTNRFSLFKRAILEKNYQLVDYLLNHGQEVQLAHIQEAFSAEDYEMIDRILIKANPREFFQAYHRYYGESNLFSKTNPKIVQHALEHGFDPRLISKLQLSSYESIVKLFFLSWSFSQRILNLSWIAEFGSLLFLQETIEMLQSSIPSEFRPDLFNESTLEKIVTWIAETATNENNCINLQEVLEDINTILRGTIQNGDIAMVSFLLSLGINIKYKPRGGKEKAILVAAECGNLEIFKFLHSHGAEIY
ncbi:MAG: hypothetical protein ACTSVZ_02350 [Promethearchaeota archaeon]